MVREDRHFWVLRRVPRRPVCQVGRLAQAGGAQHEQWRARRRTRHAATGGRAGGVLREREAERLIGHKGLIAHGT